MKTQQQITSEDLYSFLCKDIGIRARGAVYSLNKRNIFTVSQLTGIVKGRIPRLTPSAAKKKCLTSAAIALSDKDLCEEMINRLRRAMHVSRRDAERIYIRCIKTPSRVQQYNYNSGWAFGAIKPRRNMIKHQSFLGKTLRIHKDEGIWVVPGYDAKRIFDQGGRGTCVAMATCACLQHHQSEIKPSPQWTFFQAKMKDGMPDEDGTYIETVAQIITSSELVDKGAIDETVWPYDPNIRETKHHGPAPEKAYHTRRVYSCSEPIFIRETSKVEDIIDLLRRGFMVCFGIAIKESFFSYNTSLTGWVTMPLPKEATVGYHAMAVCGYDPKRRLFLVRNSWGANWACENDMGFFGHAWIPYEYVEKYCFVGVAFDELKTERVDIEEEDRLYNKLFVRRTNYRLAAVKKTIKPVRKRTERKIQWFRWMIRAAVIILLWAAYKDPIIKFKDKVSVFIERITDTGSDSRLNSTLSFKN